MHKLFCPVTRPVLLESTRPRDPHQSKKFMFMCLFLFPNLYSAMCIAEDHLCDAMHFRCICAFAAEIHCDVGHDAHVITTVKCLALGPFCDPYIARFSLVRSPEELDSVGESTKIEGQKRSSAWCRGFNWA